MTTADTPYSELTLLGQLIAEIAKFGGFDKRKASQLARILLPYIKQHDKALLARLEAEMPKKSTLDHHTKPIRYIGVPELSEYDLGRNQAITDQAAVIKRIREGL